MADITQTDDADHPLALVHHRQPAELQLLHVMHRLCEVIVLPATMDAFGHHIARHRAASIECGYLAWLVYRYLGLKFVSRSWFNLETSWAVSLVLVGAVALAFDLAR